MLIDFRQLFPRYNIRPKGVLHIGANTGQEFGVYMELGIKKQIWVEADAELCAELAANVAANPEAQVINKCISDVDDKDVEFHIANNNGQSSSFLEFGTHTVVHPETTFLKTYAMKTSRIDTIFSDLSGYDFLNIDVQGAELKALKGMGDMLNSFKSAYIEVNRAELYKGCPMIGEIDEYMANFNFRRVETIWCGRTDWGDAYFLR